MALLSSRSNGKLVSPIDGEVLSIFPTNHALGLKMDNGLEILIHVGLDTVKLNGEGFTALVQEGQRITKGTPLLEIDLDFIKRNAPSTVTPIIFTNLPEGTAVKVAKVRDPETKYTRYHPVGKTIKRLKKKGCRLVDIPLDFRL
ncbi:PTS glucose transporter subunit IIA [Peribacillus frigoritolerans]|nr:PTS glucose transporter subunit IIA [Peribacillus frigoritolerans]